MVIPVTIFPKGSRVGRFNFLVEGIVKRTVVILGLVALLLPMAALADTIKLGNEFGTITYTTAGVVSKGLELVSFNGITAPPGHSLGTVSFKTGALISGDLLSGGTFSSTGSSFVITSGGGGYGQPSKGAIFTGSFVGPIQWTLVSHTGQFNYVFTLSGKVQGMLYNGQIISGTTTQTIYVFQNQWIHDHQGSATLGNTNFAVPEPGTMGLLGTGLVALGGLRRRFLRI